MSANCLYSELQCGDDTLKTMNRVYFTPCDYMTHSARRKSINANNVVFIVVATEQEDLHIEVQ